MFKLSEFELALVFCFELATVVVKCSFSSVEL